MKKTWEEPRILVQQFMPNEYVAACGDKNKVYNFKCDAGDGAPGKVYKDSNNNGRLDLRDEALTGHILETYHACGKTHSAPTDDEFIEGFYLPDSNPFEATKVIIWTDGGTDVHCTTNLNKDSWETEKS